MVGSAIVRRLHAGGYRNIITRTRAELDLLDQRAVFDFLDNEKPDHIYLAAARVGGILANNTYRAEFIYNNLVIEANIIHGAYLAGVGKLLFLGSSCIYPKFAPQPMPEECLLTGELEYTNEPYALAKIAGIKMCESYNLQYGTNYLSVMPTNLYGPNDNFDLATSHVLPALIRKFHLGKCLADGDWCAVRKDLELRPIDGVDGTGSEQEILSVLADHGITRCDVDRQMRTSAITTPDCACDGEGVMVTIWGTGSPRREFLYSDDLADACVFMMEHVNFSDTYPSGSSEMRNTHINVGTGTDVTIRELSEIVMSVTGYRGKVLFDNSKPDGTPRKLQDVKKIQGLGWKHTIELEEGITRIYEHYRMQQNIDKTA